MSLPDVLKVQTQGNVDTMRISTEVLDPITISSSVCQFQIPRSGILDAGSFVTLGVTAAAGFFLPLETGIHSLVESCSLKIGNKVVASNDDYASYTTMVRKFESPEHRAFIDMVKSGVVGDRFASTGGRIAYRDMITDAALTTQTVPDIIKPTTDATTTPLFCVKLSDLIPMMKMRQLPLMAMKENVYLEIKFRQQTTAADVGKICCLAEGVTPASYVVAPVLTEIKFNFDSLTYTDSTMDAVMQQTMGETGLSILYEDQIVTNAAIPASSANQTIEREVGLAGRVVRNIVIKDKPQGVTHKFLGDYYSRSTIGNSSLNFRINDQRVYDRDLVSPTRKYSELQQVFGKPLMVPSQAYSYDADAQGSALTQQSTFTGTVEGHQLPDASNADAATDVDMRSTSSYEGLDLTTSGAQVLGNGARIGVAPIRVLKTYARSALDNSAREMTIYSSVERILQIRRGEVMVSE
tara:strand:+ start:842 stop:2239 length:1398 start_codon:yes stop_codon:yes gene_type:complete